MPHLSATVVAVVGDCVVGVFDVVFVVNVVVAALLICLWSINVILRLIKSVDFVIVVVVICVVVMALLLVAGYLIFSCCQ